MVLLSLSGKNPANWDSVHYRLVNGQPGLTAAFPTAKLPHRLDYGTSGIMIVGLNPESTKLLNKQFQSGTIKKHYIAMLDGWLLNDVGQINAAIVKDKLLFPLVKICNVTGKSAVSDYLVLQRLTSPPRTLVQFTPVTGRTHQLRIHSQSIGHPIIGCDLYKNQHSQQLAERLQLHASDLFFVHPRSFKQTHLHCPQPF
ncbi:RluA family pseudouridine synthase [Pseudoalteromonas sp. SG41-5]|nr:RluA family pseudouridine synthase [Pseudoalteromonas sp. SG41-5]